MEEGWGRTVSEAQISGIPAIVSDRGGLPDTVGPGGVVVPLAEPVERWCREIDALFDDAAHHAALSAAARRHAERPELAPAAVMARFLAFIGS
jgi:glycosyltransferase involved in cell wall biosynthesis